jgi:hypothetical protein
MNAVKAAQLCRLDMRVCRIYGYGYAKQGKRYRDALLNGIPMPPRNPIQPLTSDNNPANSIYFSLNKKSQIVVKRG